jgi:hydrogenase maturation protease
VKRIIIAGIGNVLLGDDGVGPYVAGRLKAGYDFGPEVEVEDLGTPALDLIDYIAGRDVFILIDSVENGKPAGAVTCYGRDHILRHVPGVRMDPHSPALGESLLRAELAGSVPAEVLLIGITGQSYEPSCNLSAPVQEAAGRVVRHVLARLRRMGVPVKPKAKAAGGQLWWAQARLEQSPAR